jgi:hypothetical protein
MHVDSFKLPIGKCIIANPKGTTATNRLAYMVQLHPQHSMLGFLLDLPMGLINKHNYKLLV